MQEGGTAGEGGQRKEEPCLGLNKEVPPTFRLDDSVKPRETQQRVRPGAGGGFYLVNHFFIHFSPHQSCLLFPSKQEGGDNKVCFANEAWRMQPAWASCANLCYG